ncbi:MAG: hypothetical protein HY645_04540 [Acidobacteria bacterium]|nr:hypothetical protein [Acidobacteriota bacterium]
MPAGRDHSAIILGVTESLIEFGEKLEQFRSLLQKLQDQIQEQIKDLSVISVSPRESPAELNFVNTAFQYLAAGKTQEEILENFLQEAQRFTRRAILFLKEGNRWLPWKSFGFPSQAVENLVLEHPQDQVVRAAQDKKLITRSEGIEKSFPWVCEAGTLPAFSVCIPLVFVDSVPVVFYGDADGAIAVDSLELLAHLTEVLIKNHYLQLRLSEQHSTGELEAALPTVPETRPVTVEETQEGSTDTQAVAVVPEPQTVSATVELPTVEESARPLQAGEGGAVDVSLGAETARAAAEEETRFHSDARRFARLLVSEIKLYHEQEVLNGRENKDLYQRLKFDFDRSREMYEKRISPIVASTTDYFHQEAVRLLAKGDPSLLGSDYPGEMIRN